MIFPLFVFVGLRFCPESPRWVASRGGSVEEVAVIVAMLDSKNATVSSPQVVDQANEIVQIARHEAEVESSWSEVRLHDDMTQEKG